MCPTSYTVFALIRQLTLGLLIWVLLLHSLSLTLEYWQRKQPYPGRKRRLLAGRDNYSGSVVSKVKPRAQCGPQSQNQVTMNNGKCIVLKKWKRTSRIHLPTECRVIIHGHALSGCLKDSVLYHKLRGFGSKTTDNKPRLKGWVL